MFDLSQLDSAGIRFRLQDADLRIGPPANVTPTIKSLVTRHRDDILRQLTAPNNGQSLAVELGGQQVPYRFWAGEVLSGDTLALDTETRPIKAREVPELAMVQASNGRDHVIIHPARADQFLHLHADRHFVFHNIGFDFWVLDKHLRQPGRAILWTAADQGRLHDIMLLDALVRIATSDGLTRNGQLKLRRNLGELASELLRVYLPKDDPYRLRFGETIGQDWRKLEPGYFQYAIKDAIVTYHCYRQLRQRAAAVTEQHKIDSGLIQRYGYLTETLQVKAAICLAAITRLGLRIDLAEARNVHQRLRDHVDSIVDALDGFGLFKRNKKTGRLDYTASGAPRKHDTVLQQQLTRIEQRLDITAPRADKTKKISKSTKFWKAYAADDAFLNTWIALEESSKLLQFLANLTTERIHPVYETLVRTGRTSCHGPNLQQLPKAEGFRELIVASPGHVLLQIDYSQIELRTFAAIALQRFGFSTLADVIAKGIDPHAYTAALFRGDTLEQFDELKQSDPDQYKALRQRAKCLNFGVPGGLGPASLIVYAMQSYGVDLTFEQARDFRHKLIRQVYPEMGVYLHEDTASILADRLRTSKELIKQSFPDRQLFKASQAIAGGTADASVYDTLLALCGNPELTPLLRARDRKIKIPLLWTHAATLTGRVRGPVPFTAARNTPFQGLACDGAKAALWQLLKSGFRIVGFIHDEMLIELREGSDYASQAKQIDQILCQSMRQLTGSVPIEADYQLCYRWSKNAETVWQDGRLIPWQEKQPADDYITQERWCIQHEHELPASDFPFGALADDCRDRDRPLFDSTADLSESIADKDGRQKQHKLGPLLSSNKCEWETPQEFFDELDREFGFTLDVCALPENAKCDRFFTPEQDGLTQQWTGVCWMNPPYGRTIREWMRKAYESSQNGATVVCLIPSRTGSKWWHDYATEGEIRYLKGRLKFGDSPNSTPFDSAVVVFRGKNESTGLIQQVEPAYVAENGRTERLPRRPFGKPTRCRYRR